MASVVIFGDIKANGQYIAVDPLIKKICAESDFVVANLEGPVVLKAKPRPEKLRGAVCSDPSVAALVGSLSISAFTLGNNHILDYGVEGLNETIDFAEARNIHWVGADNGESKGSCVLLNKEQKIAFLSFAHREGPVVEVNSSGVGPFVLPDLEFLLAQIKEYVQKGFAVIVSYHGGEEFFNTPWPRRMAWAKSLTEAGAALVYGHHSHSIQPVFKVEQDAYIAPGLGNTYFDTQYQRAHTGTDLGTFLIFNTINRQLEIKTIEADWDAGTLSLAKEQLRQPILIDCDSLSSRWAAECRRKVFGNRLNVRANRTAKDFLRSIASSAYFISYVFKRRFKNIRDTDVLLGALPWIGSVLAKKRLIGKSENFKF